jgi:hypothetical protein
MLSRFSINAGNSQDAQLLQTVAHIAAIWIVSDLGYYFLLPVVGVQPSYEAGSIAVTLYYTFWVGIAVISFWPLYARWTTNWGTFENRLKSYFIWSVAFAGCTLFAAYALPRLPSTPWTQPFTPPEVRTATPWYFLPKSVDILFQQLLVLALVLTLSTRRLPLGKIALYCALLFGGSHALLAFGDVPWGYVIRFMVAAAAFGLVFPHLILRVPNGLAYSYVLHWLYYAITVTMPRIFASAT